MISRFDVFTNLKKALGNNAGNMSIFRAITQWTLNPTVNPTLPSCVPSFQMAIDRAVKSQSAIGWPNLFRGLISASWGNVTDNTLSSTSLEDRPSSATTNNLLAGTIRALQDYSLAIWKSRNDALHQNNELSNAILLANLHHEITTMYSIKDSFSPIIQSYFSTPLEVQLLRPLRQKHRWLRLVRLATSHATAKGLKQQVMSSYFPHATTITDTAPLATAVTVTMQSVPLVSQQVPIRQYFTPAACDTTATTLSD